MIENLEKVGAFQPRSQLARPKAASHTIKSQSLTRAWRLNASTVGEWIQRLTSSILIDCMCLNGQHSMRLGASPLKVGYQGIGNCWGKHAEQNRLNNLLDSWMRYHVLLHNVQTWDWRDGCELRVGQPSPALYLRKTRNNTTVDMGSVLQRTRRNNNRYN